MVVELENLGKIPRATEYVEKALGQKLAAVRGDARFSAQGKRERIIKYANAALTRGLRPRHGSTDAFAGGLHYVKTNLFLPGRQLLAEKRQTLRAHLTETPNAAHLPWDAFVASQFMALSPDRRAEVARRAMADDDTQMQALLLRLPSFVRAEIPLRPDVRSENRIQLESEWTSLEEKFLALRAPQLAAEVEELDAAVTHAERQGLVWAARRIHAAAGFSSSAELVFVTADHIGHPVDDVGVLVEAAESAPMDDDD